MRIIVALLVSVFSTSCLAGGQMDGTAEIYYFPIGAATYIPITEEDIAERYIRYGNVSVVNHDLMALLNILNDAEEGSYDGRIVRAKIILPDGALVYVDNEGGVKVSGRTSKLSASNLSRVENLFEEITEPRSKMGE